MADVIKKRQEKEMHETAFRVENDDSLVNFTDFPVDTDESLVNLSWADSEGNEENYGHIDLLQPGLLLSIMEGNHINIKEEPMFQVVDKRQGCLGTELCISDGEHKVWTRPGTVQARTVCGHVERLTILQVKKLSFYKGWLVLDMISPSAGYRPSQIVLAQLNITEIMELSKATLESCSTL
jgi:hypothetical protein